MWNIYNKNNIDDRVYIGSSVNLKRRYYRHFSELRNNKHGNIHLQRFVNKYGIEKLKFEVIEYCEENDLFFKETETIKKYNSIAEGFNLQNPDRSEKSINTIEKIRVARLQSKFNKKINIIKNNVIIDSGTISYLSDKYNLDKSSVYKILKGKRKLHRSYNFS